MAQTNVTKVIDIERSYVPIDPMSFPESMHSTSREDSPEKKIPPVVPYDGYNFMPTGYGYTSFFGVNSELDVDALAGINVDELFIVQTNTLRNIGIALCEDGIRTKQLNTSGAWTHVITLDAPDSGSHLNWTYCVIENEVYMYRALGTSLYVMNDGNSWVPTAAVPTELNMSAQLGIFKAGGRLGSWDTENSIAWSDADDKTDFVPSLETGAGASIFQQIVGKISAVRQHGNGFVIYATRSIVYVQRTTDAYQFWSAVAVFNDNGTSYLHESCQGQPDTIHFAYTAFGTVKIENGKAEYIIPEVFSYLKESRVPVYLKLLEGRYLFFQTIDPRYAIPDVQFDTVTIPARTLTFREASYAVDNVEYNICRALNADQISQYLYDTYGIEGPLP